jgi:ribosomal protein S18 acetylase RimI-like enzyme
MAGTGAEVMKLIVLRSRRGRCVGRALMEALVEAARAAERRPFLLNVRADDPAERIYRGLGFVVFGRVPGHARSPDRTFADTNFQYLSLPSGAGVIGQ